MSDLTAEQIRQLVQETLAAKNLAPASAAPAMFAPAPAALPALRGILFRLQGVPLPDGSEASAFLLFDAEAAQHPGALEALAAHVAQAFPIQTYQPRPQWNGGGGNGYGNGYGGGYRGRRWGGGRRW
jgi:hypothetical protein